MRKEVLLAIIIGLGLGLIITFGIYTANRATRPQSLNQNPIPSPSLSTTPSPSGDLFTLVSPFDGDIYNQPTATISGRLKALSQLIILTENDDVVVTPSTDGTFSQTIKLVNGANLIELTSINDGIRQEQKINLVFSTTKYE